MYYLLNYIPCIMQAILFSMYLRFGFVLPDKMKIFYVIILLFVTPLYLLTINASFLATKHISYVKSMICMLSVIVINTSAFIVTHKIETGCFIGDVPEQIYYLMTGVPSIIVIIGTCVIYLIKRR